MTNSLNYTYIRYNVIDYTGSNVLSSYTLSNTPLTFVPDFTTSSILSGAQNISNKALRWDFGDGSYSTELRPTHHYEWPGEYNITLTVYDGQGNAYDSSYSTTVQIFNYISTQIAFEDYKSLIYDIPVGQIIDPLTLNTRFSWQDYSSLSATGYTINLYASGAHGAYNYVPNDEADKWSHLRALSRFYTLSSINGTPDYIVVDSIQPTLTEIYVNIQDNQLQICKATDPNSVLAGVTGSCQFWYTDDTPANLVTNEPPIIIFATIDNAKFNDAFTKKTDAYEYITPPPYGFQNIDPAVFASIKTRYNPANRLSVTTTGIDGEGDPVDTSFNIPFASWQNTDIPYVIKFKDEANFTTKNYPPLSSSVVVNASITPQPFYDVQTGIIYNSGGAMLPLDGVTFYEDFTSQAPQSIGAFYKGYFIATQSTENCILTASVNVRDLPYYRKDALINWITIPQYNKAIRILRQEAIDGYSGITTINLSNNANYNIDGNNVYAITVAPSGAGADNDYQTWFADPITDCLYKYDIYGNLITTYQLSAMDTLINNQVISVDYRYPSLPNSLSAASPNDITLDSKNNLWVSLFDSGVVIKIDNASGYVTTVATPLSSSYYTSSSDYNNLSGFAGENLLLPASIDTDINNNLWVAYAHPDYSVLIKYEGEDNTTTNATILTSINLPSGITPEQMQIDRNSNVWVTAINHNCAGVGFNDRNDYLYKFDINGNLIPGYPLSGFKQIGNLAIDGNQNAWIIQGAETLTMVDGLTNQTTDYIAGLGNNKTNYICSIGGITCDTANNVWVINNFDQKLYVFDAGIKPTGVLNPKLTLPLNYPSPALPPVTAYSLDPDALAYITRTDITNPVYKNQINAFVLGIKDLGLWNSMVAWPMRQSLNAGSGNTVYSLGGYTSANGTMYGSNIKWTPAGITFNNNSDYIDYGTFNVNMSAGAFSVHALVNSLGVPVINNVGTVDSFEFFTSITPGAPLSYRFTNGVGGNKTWEMEAAYFNPNFRIYDYTDRNNNDFSKDMAYSWIADYVTSQTLSSNIFQFNGVTTSNVSKTREPGSSSVNGNYIMRTYGRSNSSSISYQSTPNSRISYLLAFAPNTGMTSQTMSAVYTLCQETLNAGSTNALALTLTPPQQYLKSTTANLPFNNAFTTCCWVKRLSAYGPNYQFLFNWGDDKKLSLWGTNPFNGLLDFEINGTSLFGPYITDLNWHFIATYYDGISGYISVDNMSPNYIGTKGGSVGVATDIRIGYESDPYPKYPTIAAIDEVAHWSRVLSSDELTFLYNSGKGRSLSELTKKPSVRDNLVSWWSMEEASGTRYDSVGTNHLQAYNSPGNTTGILVNPQPFDTNFAITNTPTTPVPGTYSDGFQEFQAYGDWNGYNWLNKYAAPVSTVRTITGTSNIFNIYPSTGQYNIAKVNENWNAAGFYDSLRYQETLLDKQVFFDQFLGVIVGGLDAQPYELGKTVYEKIANYVDNNVNISKANVNELLALCTELTIDFEQYNVVLPPQLRRLIDLLSMKQSTLWGNASKYALNFNSQGNTFTNSEYGANLGTQIDPITGTIVNGTPIVAQELFSGNYTLVNTNYIDGANVIIPLSAYTPDWGWGLIATDNITGEQIRNFYNFYTYNPVYDGTYYDNVINWTDPYTTLQPTNSAYADWSGDNGIMQTLLSYELTKGLRLFTSAADITYNS